RLAHGSICSSVVDQTSHWPVGAAYVDPGRKNVFLETGPTQLSLHNKAGGHLLCTGSSTNSILTFSGEPLGAQPKPSFGDQTLRDASLQFGAFQELPFSLFSVAIFVRYDSL
ncbi:MAG: hypothetical protein ACHQVK_01140, partial [Candidatus Paceibacterales bacterium]